MTNENLCADREHALLLKETGLMEGVEPDGFLIRQLIPRTHYDQGETYFKLNNEISNNDLMWKSESYIEMLATYRLDKILAKLPEWFFIYDGAQRDFAVRKWLKDLNISIQNLLFSELVYNRDIIEGLRGQSAANAAAKLLHLLWQNKLMPEVGK